MFDYSFRRESSSEYLHKDEVVTLDSELIYYLVSHMENSFLCISSSFFS